MLATKRGHFRTFFDKQIRNDRPAKAGLLGRHDERLGPLAMDDRIGNHRDQWHRPVGLIRLDLVEDLLKLKFVAECSSVGCLNHRPIGDRVAVGKSHFSHRATELLKPGDDLGRKSHIRIAGGDKRHERLFSGSS